MTTPFETFEHTADIGLRVRSGDLPGLFAQAGRGLFSLIVEDLDAVEPRESVSFRVEGRERDYLLFDWLNELLYAFESRHLLLCEFEVTLTADGLVATARGEPFHPNRHRLEHEVKAITYHGLEVREVDEGWEAEVVVDV